jgi:hypothetical protein
MPAHEGSQSRLESEFVPNSDARAVGEHINLKLVDVNGDWLGNFLRLD